ncbi:MAG TPA: hypothetical protein VKR31_12140 [Rhizomicrobium sp.]|nr:hypothetical protein [Rhizomicrobium sp.]
MRSRFMMLFCAGVSACALLSPGGAFAVTMGSLAPHDPPANGQATEQWITDTRSRCIAADPNYAPGDSISWEGQCRRDGVIYGAGTLTFLNAGQVIETITGTFRDGLPLAGAVTATWSDGAKYEGGQLGGLFDGAGKFVSAKGETHDGEWKMGVFQSGKASVVWPNGDRYDGEWKDGKPDGQGVEVWADGHRYEGQWHDGVPVDVVQNPAVGTAPVALNAAADAGARSAPQNVSLAPQANPAGSVTPAAATPATIRTAAAANSGNATPNPALPLRAELGTQLTAVDGATMELGLTDDGFERTLVLPNGNSQEVQFAFANGPVGTVSDGEKAIGVFRARPDELDIDYADGTAETIGEGAGGSLTDRAHNIDGHAMCTAWYQQGHVFSQGEKQAAVQEYASRLGLSVSAPSKKQHAHDTSPACGGAFIASGSLQSASGAETESGGAPRAVGVPADRAQFVVHAPEQHTAALENGVTAVPTSAVRLIDQPSAHMEKASFAPEQQGLPSNEIGTASVSGAPQPGASDCLTVTSNGEYWGFQNRCTKTVQFAYCEMSDANPLTSCGHTSVAGSVAANSFSALVSDRSLVEKNAEHEFRWMACDGGAGEVVPHLDNIDPPSGRCERAVVTTQ